MSHRNARTTPVTRTEMGMLRAGGLSLRQIGARFGVSHETARRWCDRFAVGESMQDRSSRPHRMPRRSPAVIEQVVLEARRELGLGPAMLEGHLGIASSTIHKILVRAGVSRPPRPERAPVVRYERERPGELVHVDVKKLGRIGSVPGHRITGDKRSQNKTSTSGRGWDFIQVVIDDRTRLAHAVVMPDETTDSCVAAFEQSVQWFARNGIRIERAMTDNGTQYKKRWREALQRCGGIEARYTRPYRPQTNGKAERLIQTLQREWAYAGSYDGNAARCAALPKYLDHYNTRRYHTSCKSTPWQRAASDLAAVNNVRGHYS
ncbi:MAG: putative transposase [Thermoleophilia bacterium]|nr:putative transposase [Thermoleophilia bacterium]